MTHAMPVSRASGRLFLDAVLTPYRSLDRLGFRLLMVALVGTMSLVGFGFWSLGAWPVAGFCGLEVLLVWGAFRLNYRNARMSERVQLSREELVVTRTDHTGGVTEWRFEPAWVRVELDRPESHDSRLSLSMHGRRVVLGRFLTPHERVEVKDALDDALRCWHAAPGA